MAKLFPLFSGSSGNSTYIGAKGGSVLIDAGHSATSIIKKLNEHQMNTADMCGVFITHEHTDHIKGLPLLVKRTGWPVYASAATADAILRIYPELEVRVLDGSVEFDNIKVR